jgi:uncharacterized RDD family membrane protein YckC
MSVDNVFAPPKTANPLPAQSIDSTTPLWAGFWRRGAAYIIDSLLLFIPGYALGAALGQHFVLAQLGSVGMAWLYKASLESSTWQATVGKRALGIKVVGPTGERISFARATGRYFGQILSGLILGIGYLMVAFTHRKQALHDMLASTYVVRADAQPGEERGDRATMPLTWGVWVGIVLMFLFPLGIMAAVAIPAYQGYAVRAQVYGAISEGAAFKADPVFMPGAQVPDEPRVVNSHSPHVKTITIDAKKRTIVVALNVDRFESTTIQPGAQVYFMQGAGQSDWMCGARGVPDKYLPAQCRR